MKLIPNSVTRSIAGQVLKTKANSPHIFFGLGVAGVIGGTVLACRATLKLRDALDTIEEDVKDVKALHETRKENSVKFDEGEYYKDLAYVYGRGTGRMIRLYGPAVAVTGLSIVALTGSHVTMTRRNVALTAAVGTVTKAFQDYRDRVREELGPERELDIYHAAENKVVELPDGTKEIAKIVDPNKMSAYARFFDEYCSAWEKDEELNKLFVGCQQTYANQKLQAQGFLFLNDVYDLFGIPRTRAGQVVGWVLGGDGDNYIDFGMFRAHNSDFVNGRERSILLDFNVDGVIIDKVWGNK
jgi:hypothetical protein